MEVDMIEEEISEQQSNQFPAIKTHDEIRILVKETIREYFDKFIIKEGGKYKCYWPAYINSQLKRTLDSVRTKNNHIQNKTDAMYRTFFCGSRNQNLNSKAHLDRYLKTAKHMRNLEK
ncbi:hypothetical protein PVAND_016841 [Polypedilum vanderplanki]|uniref:Uncharacterized protein n=1 Tax=Polypedilum vanderplanki TaxID=319348 RepID=A0A9J6BHK0_POLVA|nr:hypothetical protein PVAND_016841 [Polypedilum vanderplanki]